MSKLILCTSLVFAALLSLSSVQAEERADYGYPEFYDAYKLDTSKLNPEELAVYTKGYVGTGRYIAGGITGTVVGFGIGHAISGEYSSMGWVFTVGELAAYGLMLAGAVDTISDVDNYGSLQDVESSDGFGMMTLGAIAFIGFRVWEAIDVWVRPQDHNNRYRMLYWRLKNEKEGQKPNKVEDSAQILPFIDRSGRSSLGLVYRF